MANEFGYSEIVDTLADACKLDVSVQSKIADGLQLMDALQFGLEAYPKVQEAIQDWPTFRQEFLDLIPAEGVAVYLDLQKALTEEEQEKSRVLRVVRLLAQGYYDVDDTIKKGENLIRLAKDVIA